MNSRRALIPNENYESIHDPVFSDEDWSRKASAYGLRRDINRFLAGHRFTALPQPDAEGGVELPKSVD